MTVKLNEIDKCRFANTSPQQALRAIMIDVVGDGIATMDYIRSEYQRRVDNVYGHLLMDRFDPKQHLAELVSNLATGGLATNDGHGNWFFSYDGIEDLKRRYRTNTRNWGFNSLEHFLSFLDQDDEIVTIEEPEPEDELTPFEKNIKETQAIIDKLREDNNKSQLS